MIEAKGATLPEKITADHDTIIQYIADIRALRSAVEAGDEAALARLKTTFHEFMAHRRASRGGGRDLPAAPQGLRYRGGREGVRRQDHPIAGLGRKHGVLAGHHPRDDPVEGQGGGGGLRGVVAAADQDALPQFLEAGLREEPGRRSSRSRARRGPEFFGVLRMLVNSPRWCERTSSTVEGRLL